MAFLPAPNLLFPNATNGTNTLILNTSDHASPSVPQMSTTEADVSSGDSRKVVFALLDRMYQWYQGLASADKPGKISITRSSFVDETTGNIVRTYVVQTTLAFTGIEVVNE
jgi:hypothetical protein